MTSPYLPLNDPIRDKDGTIVGAMNFFSDITEQANAEQATGLLAAIVDSSDDAIVSKNLDGVIMSWNKGAERIFGYLAEEAVGKHITLIIPKDRHEEETNILERLRRGERVDHFETVRIRKDGQFVDVSITISPIKDAHGRIVGASKVARDITERKRTEQALEERARLLDLSSDAIMVRDRADRVTYWNRSASELYGYSREEAMGRVTHELLRTEFPEPLERVTEKLHRDDRWSGELLHKCKDGRQIVVASRWALDRGRGGNHILETNNDITRQKQGEIALRESEERLRTLADGLETQVSIRAKELEKQNIQVLQQSEQLRELSNRLQKTQDEERRHLARELHDSAGQTITALSLNLSGIAVRVSQDAVLKKAVEESLEMVCGLGKEIRTMSYLLHPPLLDESGLSGAIKWYIEGLAERSGLNIKLEMSENFGRLPRETETAVFRIVQECLTNIHRHSGSETATIRILRNPGAISVEIGDGGRGISAERLAEIQAQRSGVGITGMRERVRHLKGTLDIQSNGNGTTIFVKFPVSGEVNSSRKR